MPFKRLVAYKTVLKAVAENPIIPGTDEEPTALLLERGHAQRLQIVATCISSDGDDAWIDDGTAMVKIRNFAHHQLDAGKTYRLVAKVRVFNEERYLVPEVVSEVKDLRWAAVHRFEVPLDVSQVVGSLDPGAGAPYEEVVAKVNESAIFQALRDGVIFEPAPGKLKVLR